MKLPKGFGLGAGMNMGDLMKQAQQAMDRAKTLEDELANERFVIERNGAKVTFDGRGMVVSIEVDKELIDPEDPDTLTDMITLACREGFEKATNMRNDRVNEIMPNVPPGLLG
ncbi:MAG: YbaB/EbfC family nucleoid-associated protein [Armatimonadetes bacterium]|nr:YbaB/EbfC family nucleoid-associated protein [Armatimonadota bacterium]